MSTVDAIRDQGRCCACYQPMSESPHINMFNLDKYKTWDYPGWGNILARDPSKRAFGRACAVLCDWCIDDKNEPILAIEIEKVGDDTRIQYHCVDLLDDADPITEYDLDPWN